PAPPLRLGADVHVHLTMKRALPFYSGEPGDGTLAESPHQALVNQVDPASLRRAGARLLFAALWPPPARAGRTRLDEALHQARALDAFARRRPDFAIARDARHARAILGRGQIALVPALEGAEAISSVADVDVLAAAGYRVIGLVHFIDNEIADAQDDQFGPMLGRVLNGRDGGLTELGRSAVRRMFELGLLVDLSHASPRTIDDVLKLAEEHGAPLLYSHAGASMHGRTLSDEHARRILAGEGVIGMGVFRSDFLAPVPTSEHWPGYQPDTCDDVIAHWAHYAALGDPRRVVLGSDFGSVIDRARPGGACPHGLRSSADLPYLFAGLIGRGIAREALDGSGELVLQLLERALGDDGSISR
ncbi:MAG: dipeptidase, partial [Myxococcota bacterium]